MKFYLLLIMLLSLSNAYGTTLEEVLDSYDFSYQDESFKLNDFNYTNSLNVYIDFQGNFGDYLFVLDFYNNDSFKFRYFNESYFSNQNKSINLSIPLVYNFTKYDLHLEIYKEDELMFRDGFEIQIDNLSISNLSNNLLFFNQTNDYEPDLKYLGFKEIKENSLIKEFIFDFETNLESGFYETKFYFANEIFNEAIKVEPNQFEIQINSSKLFELGKNQEFEVLKLLIFDENKLIESVLIDEVIGYYNLDDFIKPDVPDLTFIYNNSIYLINNGTKNAKNVSYKIIDSNLSIFKQENINLSLNQSYLLNISLSEFYIQVDFEDVILESNEDNNLFIFPVLDEVDIQVIQKNISQKNETISFSSSSSSSSSKSSSSSSRKSTRSESIKEENNFSNNIYNQTNFSQSNEINEFNFSKQINLNNISIKPKIEEKLEIAQELITDEAGFLDAGFLSFLGSIFVSIFSVIFLLL